MIYPKMKTTDFSYTMANRAIEDPYILLEQPQLSETLNWVKEENELTDRWFNENLKTEVEQLKRKYANQKKEAEYGSFSVGTKGIAATRHNSDGTSSLVWLNEDLTLKEEVSLNVEAMTLFTMIPSCTSEFLAFKGLKDGAGRPSVLITDGQAKEIITCLDGIFYSIWDKNGSRLIYSDAEVDHERGCNINSIRVYDCHTKQIETLYSTDENAVLIQLEGSHDGSIVMASIMKDYSNVLCLAMDETGKITEINKQAKPLAYAGSVQGEHLFVSWDRAPFGKVVRVKDTLDEASVLIEESDVMIESALIQDDSLIIMAMKDAHSLLGVANLDGSELTWLKLPAEYCSLSLENADARMKHEGKSLFFSFESFMDEPQLLKLENRKLVKIKETEEKNSQLTVIQKKIEVRDGTLVPCYIVYKEGIQLDGNNPSLMYAYGGYNIAMLPGYDNKFVGMSIVDWVKDGGVYVHINIRGGNEYGTKWHEEGMLKNKKNCFTDFIDVAEALQKEGWTSPSKTGICGGSNGGLLMMALTTMRPDLWGCVIASVPHTDMLRFCLDDRGPMYITEYGNPQDEAMFEYMKSYSPYHNVKAVNYPAMIIQTGECDNNVPPYHGKKMAARLQEWNTSENPILLRVLEKGSHDRGKGEAYIQTISEMQAFLKKHLF